MKTSLFVLLGMLSFTTFAQQKDSLYTPKIILKFGYGLINAAKFHQDQNLWNNYFSQLGTYSADSASPNLTVWDINLNASVGLGADFVVKSNKKNQLFLVRASIGLGPKFEMNNSYVHFTNEGVFDTVTTHSNYYTTSTLIYKNRVNYYEIYKSTRLMQLGTGFSFMTNPEKVVAFQTGLLVNYAFGFVKELTGTKTVSYNTSLDYYSGYYSSSYSDEYQNYLPATVSESKTVLVNKMVNNVAFQVPLEISFRLGRKPNFGSRMRLGLEMDPGVNMTFFDRAATYSFALTQHLNLSVLF